MLRLTHKRLKQVKEAAELDRAEMKDPILNKVYTSLIAACHHLDSVLPADPPEVEVKKATIPQTERPIKRTQEYSPPKPKKPEVPNDDEKSTEP